MISYKLVGETGNLILIDYRVLLSTTCRKLDTNTLHLCWQKLNLLNLEIK